MRRWTATAIPPLHAKVAVVTGSNSGLGLEAARLLAGAGARVLMACRNPARAEAAAARVGPAAEVVQLDLASLASVARAAGDIASRTERLDILVNNAGVMAVDQSVTEDGFEMQFGVNHLGHFALTAHLSPLLMSTPGARVVAVSSPAHRVGVVRFDDLMFEKRGYDRWRPYFQSKLANLLFAFELDRRLRAADQPVSAMGAHPGVSRTNLGSDGNGALNALLRPMGGFGQPASIGALPIVRAAVDPAARGGELYGPRLMMVGYPVRETPSRKARDRRLAAELWERSEDLTGARFEIPGHR